MLNPVEEKEVGQSDYDFDGDEAIIAQVRYEEAVNRGEIVEIESDDEDSEPGYRETEMGMSEAIQLCEKMERVCITYGTPETAVDLSRRLRQFRIMMRGKEGMQLKQSTLDAWACSGRMHC
ncbi:hypothetical protein EDD15DRAFT_2229960, partial [Pisolithus albus]